MNRKGFSATSGSSVVYKYIYISLSEELEKDSGQPGEICKKVVFKTGSEHLKMPNY